MALIPFLEAPPLISSQRPLLNYIILDIRISTYEFGGDRNIQITTDKEIFEEKI